MVTVTDLIKYLETLPQNAELVTNNSRSWNSRDIYKTIHSIDDIKTYIKVIDKPTEYGKVIKGTFVSLYDARRVDY